MSAETLKPAPSASHNWKASETPTMVSAPNREYGYRVGYIVTRHGVVGLYTQVGIKAPMTSLSIVVNGRTLGASWDRNFTDRYLKTLANRFAAQHAEVAND